jgi:hypothetical protein
MSAFIEKRYKRIPLLNKADERNYIGMPQLGPDGEFPRGTLNPKRNARIKRHKKANGGLCTN